MQGDLVTEADLKTEVQAIRAESHETERRLAAAIDASKADLIEWAVGMIGFQTAVLLGAAPVVARAVSK